MAPKVDPGSPKGSLWGCFLVPFGRILRDIGMRFAYFVGPVGSDIFLKYSLGIPLMFLRYSLDIPEVFLK